MRVGTPDIDIIVKAKDEASRIMRDVEASSKKAGDAVEKANARAKRSTGDAAKGFRMMERAYLAAAGAAAIGFGAAVKTTMDFDRQMSAVRAKADASVEDFNRMRDAAIDLGAKTIFSASEAAAGMETLAAAGLKANDIITAMPGALNAAAAAGSDFNVTADILISIMGQFGKTAEDIGHIGDVLAKAANESAVGMEDLGLSMKYAGPVANALGLSLEETAAALVILGNNGIKADSAGTALRMGFLQLSKVLDPTSIVAKKTAKSMTGLTATSKENKKAIEAQAKQFAKGLKEADGLAGQIDFLKKATEGLSKSKRVNVIRDLVGAEALPAFLKLMDEGSGALREMTGELENSTGAAQKAADIMTDNLWGALEQASGAFESMAINIGTAYTPKIRELTESITEAAEAFNRMTPEQQDKLLKSVGLLLGAGGLVWGTSKAVGVTKDLVAAWMSVAKWVGLAKGAEAIGGAAGAKGIGSAAGTALGSTAASSFAATLGTLSIPAMMLGTITAGVVQAAVFDYDKARELRGEANATNTTSPFQTAYEQATSVGRSTGTVTTLHQPIGASFKDVHDAQKAAKVWNELGRAQQEAERARKAYSKAVDDGGPTDKKSIKAAKDMQKANDDLVKAKDAAVKQFPTFYAALDKQRLAQEAVVKAEEEYNRIAGTKGERSGAAIDAANRLAQAEKDLASASAEAEHALDDVTAAANGIPNKKSVQVDVDDKKAKAGLSYIERQIKGLPKEKTILIKLKTSTYSAAKTLTDRNIPWQAKGDVFPGNSPQIVGVGEAPWGDIIVPRNQTPGAKKLAAQAARETGLVPIWNAKGGVYGTSLKMSKTSQSSITRSLTGNIVTTSASANEIEGGANRLHDLVAKGVEQTAKKLTKAKEALKKELAKGKKADDKTVAKLRAEAKKAEKNDASMKKLAKQLNKGIDADEKKLKKLADQADTLGEKLKEKTAELKALQEEAARYAAQVAAGIKGTFDDVFGLDIGGTINNMQDRVKDAEKFAANLEALKARGLSTDIIDQIASAGLEKGGAWADQLAGATDAQINEINNLDKRIGTIAGNVGESMRKTMYGTAIDAAQGLVDGLESQIGAIEAQMSKIAKAMVKRIKKELDAKSPSRLLRKVARETAGEGFALGLEDAEGRVGDAAGVMASAAVPSVSGGGGGTLIDLRGARIAVNVPDGKVDTFMNELASVRNSQGRTRMRVATN